MHYKALEVLVYESGAWCMTRTKKVKKRCVRKTAVKISWSVTPKGYHRS
jgi:hypothetical protein